MNVERTIQMGAQTPAAVQIALYEMGPGDVLVLPGVAARGAVAVIVEKFIIRHGCGVRRGVRGELTDYRIELVSREEAMRFDLTTPCRDCPWRVTDRTAKADEVADRAQIEEHLATYDCSASCHKTNDGHGVGDEPAEGEQYCVGAYLAKLKRGQSTAVIDEAIREGRFDPSRVDTTVEVI